jgi:uncharacterized membrane protein
MSTRVGYEEANCRSVGGNHNMGADFIGGAGNRRCGAQSGNRRLAARTDRNESSRRLTAMKPHRTLALPGLVVVLAGSGILHLVRPGLYREVVPRSLARWRSPVVLVSGMAELGCALLLALPRTRRVGAYASASLFIAIFPANVRAAYDGGYPGSAFPANNAAVAWLRLPLQVPLIWWALSFRHASPASATRASEPHHRG